MGPWSCARPPGALPRLFQLFWVELCRVSRCINLTVNTEHLENIFVLDRDLAGALLLHLLRLLCDNRDLPC